MVGNSVSRIMGPALRQKGPAFGALLLGAARRFHFFRTTGGKLAATFKWRFQEEAVRKLALCEKSKAPSQIAGCSAPFDASHQLIFNTLSAARAASSRHPS